MTRSTASRRARNSASLTIGARRRPASRPSRRRCFLASSRVEPETAVIWSSPVRLRRTRVTVFVRVVGAAARRPRRYAAAPATARGAVAGLVVVVVGLLAVVLGVVGRVALAAPRRRSCGGGGHRGGGGGGRHRAVAVAATRRRRDPSSERSASSAESARRRLRPRSAGLLGGLLGRGLLRGLLGGLLGRLLVGAAAGVRGRSPRSRPAVGGLLGGLLGRLLLRLLVGVGDLEEHGRRSVAGAALLGRLGAARRPSWRRSSSWRPSWRCAFLAAVFFAAAFLAAVFFAVAFLAAVFLAGAARRSTGVDSEGASEEVVVSSSGMYCSSTRLPRQPGGHRRSPSRGRSVKPSWRRHPRGVTPSPADPCRGRRP